MFKYDYIIPNKGYVGFYLTVQNKNCSPRQPSNINNNNNQYDQSIIVGPKFHSYINVQVQYGILLQQKAFLQIYNHTAYQLIKDLSNELYKAKYLTQFTIESIWKIYKQLKQMNKDILLSHTLSMIDNDPNDPNDLNDPNDNITSLPYHENHQFRSKFTIMNCSQLFLYYEEQMNHIGKLASGALTRLDHVNIELHNLMDNNHLIRLIFPKTLYPYHELSISSMVSLSIRLSKLNVPTVYESSTFPVDIYLKSKLLL
ncbi:hypothetical protein Smp_142070 [Schistosoma mansoni]|uniref:hypothetical protein n=1 Tax=Schistosoma mansoni TaxID=6183 RepID=UPI00022C86BF|nr:hypothetical protein Smp_142070 [Schistosoma mansoni]|eukprot:XP_018645114.1 hypothetical protein Smp_142070 [Schistosoma mansoni]